MLKRGNVRVVNLKSYKPMLNEVIVRVDRQSPVGNPFFMKSESERDKVCEQYEEYFNRTMAEGKDKRFIGYIERIEQHVKSGMNVTLACWCAPKRCHAETIVNYIEGR